MMKTISIPENLAVAIAQLLGQMPASQSARALLALVDAMENARDADKEPE